MAIRAGAATIRWHSKCMAYVWHQGSVEEKNGWETCELWGLKKSGWFPRFGVLHGTVPNRKLLEIRMLAM